MRSAVQIGVRLCKGKSWVGTPSGNGGTTPRDSTFHRSMNTKGRDEDIPAPKQLNRYPEFVTVFRNDAAKSARQRQWGAAPLPFLTSEHLPCAFHFREFTYHGAVMTRKRAILTNQQVLFCANSSKNSRTPEQTSEYVHTELSSHVLIHYISANSQHKCTFRFSIFTKRISTKDGFVNRSRPVF